MPFGIQHYKIFLMLALIVVLSKIQRESDTRFLNYEEDLLILHQNEERLREQIQTVMMILETFGWIIVQKKCKVEPKQQINFL
ncbi:MAG: hypothetical protein EZS28_009348 [Streblomastix strix]|uniref:Reverse transcriptase domain-containing protein n=1 Tax=Streblomastix strix TaxID=222440 RepID=A0A5J4WJF8_9EUKA|nr:MAG: hypothetical protein EZS28_009348 [Streblomastix strix]